MRDDGLIKVNSLAQDHATIDNLLNIKYKIMRLKLFAKPFKKKKKGNIHSLLPSILFNHNGKPRMVIYLLTEGRAQGIGKPLVPFSILSLR